MVYCDYLSPRSSCDIAWQGYYIRVHAFFVCDEELCLPIWGCFIIQFEIRLCPALQKKPNLPTPHFDPHIKSQEELPVQDYNGGRPDPFSQPYLPNLHVGDLKDEREYGDEYAILVSDKRQHTLYTIIHVWRS